MGRPKLYAVKGHKNLRRTTPRAREGTLYYGDFEVTPIGADKPKRFRPRLGSDMEKALTDLRQIIAETKHRLEQPERAEGPRTLSEAQARHLELFGGQLRKKSLKGSEQGDRNALRGLGDILLAKLSTEAIQGWAAARYAEREVSTVNRDLVRLKQVTAWATRAGWMSADPAAEIKLWKVPEGRIRYLLDEEEQRLREACLEWQWDWMDFAFSTGLREGEQLHLEWRQIRDGQIHLEGAGTKNHRRRSIPIEPNVAKILERQRQRSRSPLVFPSPRGKVWQANNFRNRFWTKLFAKANLTDFLWHDFRHTFCSRLVMAGADLYAVKKLAGHRSYKVTEMYAHLAPDHLRSTMALLSRGKSDGIGRPPQPTTISTKGQSVALQGDITDSLVMSRSSVQI